MPENLGKNPIISYLLIVVVITYSLLKMAAVTEAEVVHNRQFIATDKVWQAKVLTCISDYID